MRRTDQIIAYSGETPQELFDYLAQGQHHALVQAFCEGIRRKAKRRGEKALTPEERTVLAVTALEQEVYNGGYDQFFRNKSRKFVPIIVESLRRIGRKKEAEITKRALAALQLRNMDERMVKTTMSKDDIIRDEQLQRCDQEFYGIRKGMAEYLYSFIKANRDRISFP